MSRVISVKIIENHPLTDHVLSLTLDLPADYPRPLPGQFINVYLNDKSKLLPRPLSVCDWNSGRLMLVYAVAGSGTGLLSRYECGMSLRVSTPLGNGFTVDEKKPGMIIGGGLGAAPMLYLSKQLLNASVILGFRDKIFLTTLFPCPVEVATEDGSQGAKGNVADVLHKMDIPDETILYACGPKPMLKALARFCEDRGLTLQVSLEERMGCGYGACVGCICKTHSGNRKVCEDGPVFMGGEVNWDA